MNSPVETYRSNGRINRLEAERIHRTYARPSWFPEDAMELETGEAEGPPRPGSGAVVARSYRDDFDDAYGARPARRGRRGLRRSDASLLLGGALVAAIGGTLIGLAAQSYFGGGAGVAAWPQATAAPKTSGGTVIAKKRVALASLTAGDAEGQASSPIALSLDAAPGAIDQTLDLRLGGLPGGAWLTAGTRIDQGSWLLKPEDMNGLKLIVPEALSHPLALTLAAIDRGTGKLAAPVKSFNVAVTPLETASVLLAAAPPAAASFAAKPRAAPVPKPVASSSAEAETLIARGEALVAAGDFAAARGFFKRALELGAPRAALRLAETYDPAIFAARRVRGLAPDPVLAHKYYSQAKTLGVFEALAPLALLERTGAQ